jgi:hypothetical protein
MKFKNNPIKNVVRKTAKFGASIFLMGAISFGSVKAMSPDTLAPAPKPKLQKVVPYPYMGGGMGSNFTVNQRLGDFAYISQNMAQNSKPSTLLWVNKDIGGVRLVATTMGKDFTFSAMQEILPNTTIGVQYTTANQKPAYAISYFPIHNQNNMTQIGLQYNSASSTYDLAAESRFKLNSKMDITLAGGLSLSDKTAPYKNAGIQLSYDNLRLSTNYDGNRFLIAPQIYLGKYLPDAGFSIQKDGKISGWIGVTYLL